MGRKGEGLWRLHLSTFMGATVPFDRYLAEGLTLEVRNHVRTPERLFLRKLKE